MSNGEQAPAKKGIPVWAWIGIGCAAMVILVLVVVMVGGFFVARKVQDVAADFEENPTRMVARGIIMANPDLEEVSADDEAGTITIRNTKTGEIITMNYDDIKEGKLSFTTDEGEISIDASEMDEGSLKVTNEEGEVVLSTGGAVSEDIPSWVPIYAGGEPTSRHTMSTEQEQTGGFESEVTASVKDVLDFYQEALKDDGYEVAVNTFSQDNSEGGMVNGSHGEKGRNVVVIINSENGGPTKIVVSYTERKVAD